MIDLIIETDGDFNKASFPSSVESVLYLAEMKISYGGYYVRKNAYQLDFAIVMHGAPSTLLFDGPPEDIASMHKFFLFDELIEAYAEGCCDCVPFPLCGHYGDGSIVVPRYLPALAKECGKGERIKISYMLAFGVRRESEIRNNLHVPLSSIAVAIQSASHEPQFLFSGRET